MADWLIKRQLRSTSAALARHRVDLEVTLEQLAHGEGDSDEWQTQAIVTGHSEDATESRRASASLTSMRDHRDHLRRKIAELEARQDLLLDQLSR